MAKLIMVDGTVRQVDYNTAAKVYEVLTGAKKPEDKKQEEFALQVKDVHFNDGLEDAKEKDSQMFPGKRQPPPKQPPDPKLQEAMNGPLKGYEKFKAIGRVLKERREAKKPKEDEED